MGPPHEGSIRRPIAPESHLLLTALYSYLENSTAERMIAGIFCTFVRWVVGSILHGGPIELFLAPVSASLLLWQRPWYSLSCLWDGAYKIPFANNQKDPLSYFCFSTGVTKAMVCVILSVGWCI